MKYSVPNAPDVPHLDQAEPDDFDYQALGYRKTGVTSGGNVTALGTPGPSVQVSAGIAVIADNPVRFAAGTVAVAEGGGNPRFDIIAVSDTGVLTNIAGASSANALFADFDFTKYAPLAAVYIPPGSTSVQGSHIALKTAAMPNKLSRTYNTPGATFLEAEVLGGSPTNYRVTAEGEHYWSSSSLKRLTTYTMQWITSLVMKAVGVDSGRAVLILQTTDTVPHTQRLLKAEAENGAELAYINGEGQLYADNLKYGTWDPNGNVTGKKGDIYISRGHGGTSRGIWQKGGEDGTKSGWKSFRVYDSEDDTELPDPALPPGSIIYSLSDTAPPGFIAPHGQWISTDGPTAELAAVIGAQYGTRSGERLMPDLRGRTLAYSGSGDSPPFTSKGADEMQLTRSHMPSHDHNINDPGHDHPQAGPYAYIRPWQFHNNRHPVPSDSALEHIYTEDLGFNKHSRTGVKVLEAGGDTPFSLYQPTHFLYVYVKL